MAVKHAKVEHWDDERSIGNSLIVTLKPGWRWAFDPMTPCHVEGFDRVAEAKAALRCVLKCECAECKPKH
jgi:hypothetical protein